MSAGELFRLLGRRDQRDADARLADMGRREPDEQRDRGDDLEIQNRAEGEPPDLLQVVAVAGNPDDEAAEDQRGHDRLDHSDEDAGKGLEALSHVGVEPDVVVEVPDHGTYQGADQDPVGQVESAHGLL